MIVLSAERFETFKKCICLCAYAKVNAQEFLLLSEFQGKRRVIKVKKEGASETATAEISVMLRERVHFSAEEKQKIAIELRPSKEPANCKFFNDIRLYKNNDLTD